MCLSTGLFFGPVSPGTRALEALKLQRKECSSLFLELSPHAYSQACPVTTQPSCCSLNIIFHQKVFNRTTTVTTLQIPGGGYLYLFVLLNFILPLWQYLTWRVSIIEPFHTQNHGDHSTLWPPVSLSYTSTQYVNKRQTEIHCMSAVLSLEWQILSRNFQMF